LGSEGRFPEVLAEYSKYAKGRQEDFWVGVVCSFYGLRSLRKTLLWGSLSDFAAEKGRFPEALAEYPKYAKGRQVDFWVGFVCSFYGLRSLRKTSAVRPTDLSSADSLSY